MLEFYRLNLTNRISIYLESRPKLQFYTNYYTYSLILHPVVVYEAY